jgi:murein DD-endopeptidase MepM/ murein hydrolase activator NlpD
MRNQKIERTILYIFLLAFFTVLGTDYLEEIGRCRTLQQKTVEDPEFRKDFFSESMRENRHLLSEECKTFLENVENEVNYHPIPESVVDKSLKISYIDGWMAERTYKGKRGHEGTDVMASLDKRGVYPVLSMTDGVITNLGWLEKGGYRVGITSNSGTYYYYAHLDSYANISEGSKVKAGELLGYMGDSGYGPEGTKGQFAVHLHVGIYTVKDGQEISVNPYYVLQFLEDKKLKYEFSEF